MSKIEIGDKVGIIAPAGKGSEANLPKISSYIESLGLVPVISENIYDQNEPFYSNTDEFRAQDLIKVLLDEEIKLIWCIRGGSGCIRLIPFLDAQLPEKLPQKYFIGFSDITVLHLYFEMRYNWKTLHGSMLEGIVNDTYDQESLQSELDLIFGRESIVKLPIMSRLDGGLTLPSLAGKVVGGNMTLVECSIGTKWQVNITNAGNILFLEETGEVAYRLERTLDHMKEANIFQSFSAVIFGDLTGGGTETDLVLQRFADSIGLPVFKLTGVGHGSVNFPLPLNSEADIILVEPTEKMYSLFVDNILRK